MAATTTVAIPAHAAEESGSNQLLYLMINFGLLLVLLLWKARKPAAVVDAIVTPAFGQAERSGQHRQ